MLFFDNAPLEDVIRKAADMIAGGATVRGIAGVLKSVVDDLDDEGIEICADMCGRVAAFNFC